ncbi:hypothetical protein ATEIFO6365_0001035500 [Aspergillus terreus]|uniref:Uncharacterized protein n=1 Tax=Aspergillus terreus TaxID=33178 RepID=A0A5M3YMD1_ASPTE|nr:hypothetical protein ATETN484_0001027600 [Aspergillus terreus]GFF12132.1 hypothetical protein ATEIFO6365_0001035500 [Aspergillus terreus]
MDKPYPSPEPTLTKDNPPETPAEPDEYTGARKSKFRFKRPSKHRSRSHSTHADDGSHRRRHSHSHHHHRSKRRKHRRSPSPDPTLPPPLPAEDAFRESLFDALGDDEGAAYWETVYGQPIHTYAVPHVAGPNGELEQMSDEEYAAYVRARMWERTREGMLEAQEQLRAERARQRRRDERREEDVRRRRDFDRDMEACLARGRERRRVKAWKTVWEEYVRSWERVDQAVAAVAAGEGGEATAEANRLRNLLFWPVESGKRRDVSRDAVREFMRHAPSVVSGDTAELLAVLKAERVRWHPDKMQQRYGALGIDEVVMRSVTEVFQIIDHMWSETREKQS